MRQEAILKPGHNKPCRLVGYWKLHRCPKRRLSRVKPTAFAKNQSWTYCLSRLMYCTQINSVEYAIRLVVFSRHPFTCQFIVSSELNQSLWFMKINNCRHWENVSKMWTISGSEILRKWFFKSHIHVQILPKLILCSFYIWHWKYFIWTLCFLITFIYLRTVIIYSLLLFYSCISSSI